MTDLGASISPNGNSRELGLVEALVICYNCYVDQNAVSGPSGSFSPPLDPPAVVFDLSGDNAADRSVDSKGLHALV